MYIYVCMCVCVCVGGIGLHVKPNKTEFMCLNQRSNILTRNGRYLKLVDKFNYRQSSVSSTKWTPTYGRAKAGLSIGD